MNRARQTPAITCLAVLLLASLAIGQEKPRREQEPKVKPPTPANVQLPPGFEVEVFAAHLSYPVDITFSDDGKVYVAEAGGHTYGTKPQMAPPARILELLPNGQRKVIYDKVLPLDVIREAEFGETGSLPEGIIMPLTGLTWHDGKLYVSHRSRYSVLDPQTGQFKTIIDNLPCWGEFLNAKPIFDADGKMVFFISTQGNTGVIEDHWIKVIRIFNKPGAHEIPGEDVTLTGINYPAPAQPGKPEEKVPTGVYVPLGTTTRFGQIIKGQKICNGAFFRANRDGSNIERIAWGFRSCFGYRFSPDGRLITTQNSANPMTPRGIRYDYEPIYQVLPGLWYGWPDFYSGIPITDERFKVREGPQEFVLTKETHQKLLRGETLPPQPIAKLPVHSAAEGMVFGRRAFGIDPNNILVAEMGSIVPLYKAQYDDWPSADVDDLDWPPEQAADGKVPPEMKGIEPWPGFQVALVNLETGKHVPFLRNKSGRPASVAPGGGLERPIQLEWGPDGALYVVDFGVIEFSKKGLNAHPNTGVIWRVSRAAAR